MGHFGPKLPLPSLSCLASFNVLHLPEFGNGIGSTVLKLLLRGSLEMRLASI